MLIVINKIIIRKGEKKMKLKLKEEQAKKIIEAYYKKYHQLEGSVVFESSVRDDNPKHELYRYISTKMISTLSILGEELPMERELREEEVQEAITVMLKKEGYQVSSIFHNNDFELNVVEEKIENERIKNLKCYEGMLLVVDMVNGFVTKGDLHDKEIGKIVPRQIELLKEAKANNHLVVFIKDTHTEESTENKRFGKLRHCIEGSGEEEVIDKLKPFEEDAISIQKNSTSFMEAPDFRELIEKTTNLKTVDVVGCCTDICDFNGTMGLANYFDQWNRDVEIYMHQDAIATLAEEARQNYVDAANLLMKQQGIRLVKKK